jgi:hypothetical protein
MTNKYTERCLISVASREKQMKSIMRYHSTSSRMTKIKITDKTKFEEDVVQPPYLLLVRL